MEIITGVERRRRWRVEEKLRIVAECECPGACLAAVARLHDVSAGCAKEQAERLSRCRRSFRSLGSADRPSHHCAIVRGSRFGRTLVVKDA